MSARTLTLFAHTGLSNRLDVLVSGLALAEASGRELRMLWPRTPACGASFGELFANDWPVEEVEARDVADLPYGWSRHHPDPPDLLAATAEAIVLGSHRTLVRPDLYPGHAALVGPCLARFSQLRPIDAIEDASRAFRARHFRPAMIGVHLRRGDFAAVRPDLMGNTAAATSAVESALQRLPGAGVFLATDDGAPDLRSRRLRPEGVRERFARRFGERVVWTTPRSLERHAPEAVQDALVDLWLLRQTDYLVGSVGSAFSRLALYGRAVPHTLCAGSRPAHRRAVWLCRVSGIHALLRWLGRREFGRDLAFPSLVRFYRASPRRLWAALAHPRQGELEQPTGPTRVPRRVGSPASQHAAGPGPDREP